MGAVRFPVPCPRCGYQASGRLRVDAEDVHRQHRAFLKMGGEDLRRECPEHNGGGPWPFTLTNAWERVLCEEYEEGEYEEDDAQTVW